MLATTLSASILGVEGTPVRVEVDVAFGLPGLTVVGLAGSAVQEARERVRSALRNSGFEVPARRITINLAPADLPKEGTGHDLAMAVGVLAASGQLNIPGPEQVGLVAELALDGALRPVPGAMALAASLRDAGLASLVVAGDNVAEAAAIRGLRVYGAGRLGEVVSHLAGVRALPVAVPPPAAVWQRPADVPELGALIGQRVARRALEIAVAGRHNLVLSGPPGVGKSLVLRAAVGLLPALTDDEAPEVSRIYSVAGLLDRRAPLVRQRPVRAPHHTVSTQALVGGGPRVRPGEASLAHRGLLILDEMLQFRADALDALRQPMESGSVTIARVDGALTMPAQFVLLGAFNACPCGWYGVRSRSCICDEGARRRYQARLSGPLRDRIDLFVSMESVAATPGAARPEGSAAVRARVSDAWCRQLQRQGMANGELPSDRLDERSGLSASVLAHLSGRARRFGLSPRRVHRAARLARTIADLEAAPKVQVAHVDEALRHRPSDGTP